MEIEERVIYPVVQRVVGKEEAEEAGVEHGLAREGLSDLQRLVDEPGFGAAVAMLTAGIRHHVKEEEQEVFPELKRKIDREELRQLGDEVAAAKSPKRRSRAAGATLATALEPRWTTRCSHPGSGLRSRLMSAVLHESSHPRGGRDPARRLRAAPRAD